MSRITLKQTVLFLLVVMFTTTGLLAQSKDEFNDPIGEEQNPTSLEEISGFDELKVWSSTGTLNLSFTNQTYSQVEVHVYDITGREIISEKKQKSESKFSFQHDSSTLPSSVYIVRIGQGKKLISKKIYL